MDKTIYEKEREKFLKYISSPEYLEKLDQRLKVQDACLKSKEARKITYSLCQDDPIFFIENFAWTYDPRPYREPNRLPFFLFDYQKKFILWLIDHVEHGKDAFVEKSRDMGVTWCLVWLNVYMWNFRDTFSSLLGSYKEDLVDNGTLDSLFGMIEFGIRNIPQWLLPPRFDINKHKKKLKLINPHNHNLIAGDSMNQNFSRGSRKSLVFFDEAASWEYFRDAWESAGDTTPCRIAGSTPKGRNQFALLRESDIDRMTIHWKEHPLKDQVWYEDEKLRRTDEEVAQELDISYHKSQEGRVYPEWDLVEWGEFNYNDLFPLYTSWDYGMTDSTAMIWWQVSDGGEIIILDCYDNRGKTIDYYIPFVNGILDSDINYTSKDLKIISEHRQWKRGMHFGDPAGRYINQVTNTSVMDVLKKNNIHVNFREDAKDFQTRKTEAKKIMKRLKVNDNERTRYLGICIENSKYPKIRTGGADYTKTIKPIHDFTSHYRSSLEYFAVNFNRSQLRRERVMDKFPVKPKGENRRKSLTGY